MAETTSSTEAAPQETVEQPPAEKPEKTSTGDEPNAPGRVGKVLAWALLVLLGAFVCIQFAGVLLRDRLERRRPLLAHAPAPEPADKAVPAKPLGPEPSRFGPEIQEVVVASAQSAPVEASNPQPEVVAPKAAPPVSTLPPAKAPPALSSKAVSPPVPATPAKVTPATPPAAPPKAAAKQEKPATPELGVSEKGTHVLFVGVFLGQEYLKESEQQLKTLHVPAYRTEFLRKGPGFKVQVKTGAEADRDKARKVLESGGYLHKVMGNAVESYFLYRREALPVVEALTAQGLSASVAAVQGQRPYWKLYAGPFSEEDADKVKKKLAAAGVKTTVEARP